MIFCSFPCRFSQKVTKQQRKIFKISFSNFEAVFTNSVWEISDSVYKLNAESKFSRDLQVEY